MNHLIAQSLQNIEDVTDGAPEPKTLSAGATPDQGASPLVGTGSWLGSRVRIEKVACAKAMIINAVLSGGIVQKVLDGGIVQKVLDGGIVQKVWDGGKIINDYRAK